MHDKLSWLVFLLTISIANISIGQAFSEYEWSKMSKRLGWIVMMFAAYYSEYIFSSYR